MKEEKWKYINGYGEKYEISNFGRVRSHYGKEPKILKQNDNVGGYPYVNLYYRGYHKAEMIHRLVAKAFIDNPNNYNLVMHLDDNKKNNYTGNLKWGTQKENLSFEHFKKLQSKNMSKRKGNKNPFYGKTHSEETKEKLSFCASERKGRKNPNCKKVICDGKIFYSVGECSKYYNLKYSTLTSWLNGNNKIPCEWEEKGLSYYE